MASPSRLFCARCGASKTAPELYKGLCGGCLSEHAQGARHPPVLRGMRCPRCSSVTAGGKAVGRTIEETFRGGFRLLPDLRGTRLDLAANPGADPWSGVLRYTLTGKLDSVPIRQEGEVPYRLKPEVCESCSRVAGNYYEGVVQVRATGRSMTPVEKRRALDEAGGFGVIRVDEEAGGVDLRLQTERETERLARRLAEVLGGTTSASPKVAGRRDGREIYRISWVVRLHPFEAGDVVRVPGRHEVLLHVERWKGKTLLGTDLATGRRRTVETAGVVRVGGGVLQATVVSSTETEIQVLDSSTLETVTLARPPFLGRVGDEVAVVRTDRGLFIVPLSPGGGGGVNPRPGSHLLTAFGGKHGAPGGSPAVTPRPQARPPPPSSKKGD